MSRRFRYFRNLVDLIFLNFPQFPISPFSRCSQPHQVVLLIYMYIYLIYMHISELLAYAPTAFPIKRIFFSLANFLLLNHMLYVYFRSVATQNNIRLSYFKFHSFCQHAVSNELIFHKFPNNFPLRLKNLLEFSNKSFLYQVLHFFQDIFTIIRKSTYYQKIRNLI